MLDMNIPKNIVRYVRYIKEKMEKYRKRENWKRSNRDVMILLN